MREGVFPLVLELTELEVAVRCLGGVPGRWISAALERRLVAPLACGGFFVVADMVSTKTQVELGFELEGGRGGIDDSVVNSLSLSLSLR